MGKNYASFFWLWLIGGTVMLTSQEIKIFTVSDFDLKGKVKRCLVSTDYGKEEYDFNEDGLLTKSVTRYSESDYELTYYIYKGGFLVEKRLENYQDNSFDNATSVANFYKIDSTAGLKVTENIVSYDKEFLDLFEYHYDQENNLTKIIRSNNQGTDETNISYKNDADNSSKIYELNGVVTTTIKETKLKINDSVFHRKVLTKKFIYGEPNTAVEEVLNESNTLLSRIEFVYNAKTTKFVKQKALVNTFDESGTLVKSTTTSGTSSETKGYSYQFDTKGNWVKEITTPDNTYKSRKIIYYEKNQEMLKPDK